MPVHGSSARTTAQPGDAQRWRGHPVAAFFLRGFISIGPIVLAFATAAFVGRSLDRGEDLVSLVIWIGCLLVVSTATVVVADRFLRGLLPLVALLKLSLAFPGENVPSRVRFALRSGTARQLEKRLETGQLRDGDDEAAKTLLTLLTVLRDHDRLTRGHSERVRAYSSLIGEQMGLSAVERDRLNWAALIHDVGKLAVDPGILGKNGKPSPAQWEELRKHPAAAASLVTPVRSWLGDWADAATQHHERWDGGGYPSGLSGEEISLAGRIVAVADAFDVMTSTRSYKPALPFDDALAELTRNAGSQFDPAVVRAFLAVPPRRLRLVMGAFGWVGNLSFVGEVGTVAGAGGTAASAASAALATAAVVASSAMPSFGFLNSDEQANPWAGGDPSQVERVVDDRDDGEQPPTSADTSAQPTTEPTSEPGTPTTNPTVPTTTTPGGASTTAPPGDDTTTTTTTTVVEQEPFVVDDSFAVVAGETENLNVMANDYDPDGSLDPSSVTIIAPPTSGSARVLPNGRILYTAPPEEAGLTDSLTYRVCDDSGLCGTAVVSISIVD